MLAFIKNVFIGLLSASTLGNFGESLASNSYGFMNFVSLNNQTCQARPTLLNINSDETLFYPLTVSVNNCRGSCSIINDVCVPNKVNNMNVKVFTLMSGVNETKCLVKQQSCKCRLHKRVCNSKEKRNHDKCQCECKESDDWGSCKNYYIWNPTTYNCECNKACKTDEYLEIRNYSCKKRLIGKLVLECEDEMLNATETLLNDKKVTLPYPHYFIGFICLLLLVVICVSCYFYCSKYQSKQKHLLPFQDTNNK